MTEKRSVLRDDGALPEVVSSRTVYEGKVVSLRVDEIALSQGGTAVREVVEHSGAVVMAAVDEQRNVYFVRQYRHPVGGYLLELPAGGLEPGEEPMAAAKRELREEVGLLAERWTSLGSFYSSPGFANERLYAFLAEGLHQVADDPDEDEELIVIRYPLDRLFLDADEITDAKTLAALMLLRERYG